MLEFGVSYDELPLKFRKNDALFWMSPPPKLNPYCCPVLPPSSA